MRDALSCTVFTFLLSVYDYFSVYDTADSIILEFLIY